MNPHDAHARALAHTAEEFQEKGEAIARTKEKRFVKDLDYYQLFNEKKDSLGRHRGVNWRIYTHARAHTHTRTTWRKCGEKRAYSKQQISCTSHYQLHISRNHFFCLLFQQFHEFLFLTSTASQYWTS